MMINAMSLHAESIEVFSVSARPVSTHQKLRGYCDMDALARLTDKLNQVVGDKVALNQVHMNLAPALRRAFICQQKARDYELTFLPAIVIDKTFVAYGLDSDERALQALNMYREASHE